MDTDFVSEPTGGARKVYRWRVVDIVVASVLAVAAGLVFVLWNIASNPIGAPLGALLPGLQALLGGGWLFAGVLTALVIRKPGAALYGELVAATVSALVGNQWGVLTLESGLVQGLAAELVFAVFWYRLWNLPVAVLAGAAAGLALAINDLILWYPGSAAGFSAIYIVSAILSGAALAGGLSWFVVRGLAKTGAPVTLPIRQSGIAPRRAAMTAPSRQGGGVAVAAQGWHWRHAGRSQWALRNLDLVIEPGERVLLLGASGSGKSTLLQGLAGLLDSSEDGDELGRLLVDGGAPAQRRSSIGMVLQNPDSQVILSRVGDDVAFGMENYNVAREAIWPRVRRALTAVGLDLPLRRDTAQLSGGQQQRLALAGVLAMNPGLILLDEPTANLDPAGVIEVRDAVAAATEQTGATLVVIEHRTAVWLPVVDRVIVLGDGGRVVADGPPDDTIARQRENLRRAGVWVPGADLPVVTRNHVPGAPLLDAANLSVGYPSGRRLGELNFHINRAATTIVTGPNGAGKSALALTLGGLLAPHGGRLEALDGFPPAADRREPVRWRSRELLTRIGSVFQNPEHQFLTGSVRDELALGPRVLKRDRAAVAAICDGLLDRLHLAHLTDVNPYTLSGGEKRRLSVATVLATRPDLIVLDEPTFGQDRNTWEELVRLIAEITDAGTAVVAITHDLDFAGLLADSRIELPALDRETVTEATC